MYLEMLQVRRAQVLDRRDTAGHAIFPSVIRMMAAGLVGTRQDRHRSL